MLACQLLWLHRDKFHTKTVSYMYIAYRGGPTV